MIPHWPLAKVLHGINRNEWSVVGGGFISYFEAGVAVAVDAVAEVIVGLLFFLKYQIDIEK